MERLQKLKSLWGEVRMKIEQEIVSAGKGATGAVALLTSYGITMNDIIGALTIVYLIAQIGYLGWKWLREANKA